MLLGLIVGGVITFGVVAFLLDDGKEKLEFPPSYYENLKNERIAKYGKSYSDYYLEFGFNALGCICQNQIQEIQVKENYTEVYLKTTGYSLADVQTAIPIMEKQTKSRIIFENIPISDLCKFTFIFRDYKELPFKQIELSPFQLLVGYDFKGDPVITDMLLTPHLLVTGLSGNGKTGCIRIMIKNLLLNNNADIVLLNAFMDDYEGFNVRGITNHDDIKSFIKGLLEGIGQGLNRNKPLYVIFEELGKVKDKELIDLTTKLLQYGRHNKIYLIGIIQTATKEELKFKSLFNARLTFKQLEESSYRVVLGCSVIEKLRKREFYLFTDDLYKGKTYKLDF